MKILVTGGAGFIGSHLADALIRRGDKVSIIDDLSTGRREHIHPAADFFHLDINDAQVDAVFKKEKPDVVYHLAFNTNVPQSVADPLFDARGISGSLNVFLSALRHRVKKVIMASSAFVYGNTKELPLTEAHSPQPVSPYAISKIASENYLRFFNEAYELPIVILRYATVYGPRQAGGALADYIRKIAADERAEMYGDGALTRDYVYVDDIVRANLLAADAPQNYENPIFNLGSGEETALTDLYGRIGRLLGKPDSKPIFLPARPGEMRRFVVSHERARREFGWRPTVNLDEGLLRTARHKPRV